MGDFFKALFDAIRSSWKIPATLFVAAVLALWGPGFLRPNLANGIAVTPLSDWIRLIVVDTGVAAGLIWGMIGIKWAFDSASKDEDDRNRAPIEPVPVVAAEPVDADAVLFGEMEQMERRALGYFIVAGRSTLPWATFTMRDDNPQEIYRALLRLCDRGFVTHFNPHYDYGADGREFTLRDTYFRRLSLRPGLLGIDIQPRRFADER